ncbi:MAG TPA: hypothetical protein VK906_10700, partial [Egicoccus sp.]
MSPTRPADGASHVADLAAGLRRDGVPVGTGQVTACASALADLEADDLEGRYWAGRVTLCSEPAHVPVYDRVFAEVVSGGRTPPPLPFPDEAIPEREAGSDRAGGGGGDEVVAGALAMAQERLRHRRFDRLGTDERREVDRLVDALRVSLPRR